MSAVTRLVSVISVLCLGIGGCSGGGGSPVQPEPPQPAPLDPMTYSHVGRTPVSDNLRDVAVSGDVMFGVGSGGAVVAKLPGQGWVAMPRITGQTLRGVTMLDENTVIAVGSDIIIRSADRGATWKVVAQNTGALNAVSRNEDIVIAVGGGTVRFSGDGGENWKSGGSPPPVTITQVAALDQKNAIAASSFVRVYRTADAGNTWTEISTDFDGSSRLSAMAFADAQKGVVGVRSPNEVYFTADAGDTWQPLGISEGVLDIAFFDDTDGALMTTLGNVYTTDNGGKSWTAETFTMPLDEFDVAPKAIARGPASIAAVGTGGYIVESVGGGAFLEAHAGRAGNVTRVGLSSTFGLASVFDVDHAEDFLRSFDDGQSWSAVDLGIGAARRILIDGSDGLLITKTTVMRSASGGVGWAEVFNEPTVVLMDAAMVDAQTYVVCLGDEGILHTNTGGTQWADVTPPDAAGESITKVCVFPGTTVGVAAGPDIMLRTTDGGETWSPVQFLGRDPTAMAAASEEVAVIANDNFDIWRTGDGGQTWDIIGQTPGIVKAAAFADPRRGLMVGSSGLIIESLDGGLVWSEPSIATDNTLSDVTFLDEGTAIIVGERGTILRGIAP